MNFKNYKEGQYMQRRPLFEANGFIYWKNNFETYVRSKDIDLWNLTVDGYYVPVFECISTDKNEIVSLSLKDEQKKMLSKNNE